MGLLAEASAAAAKVLEIDSGYRKAHYVRATALARMGANEESDREFDIFRKVEEEARSQTDRIRYMGVLNRDAAAKLLEGHPEEAVEMFLNIIQSFPDSATAYLNLGFAQSRIGQHKAAAETFQKILSQSISDSFLVYGAWHGNTVSSGIRRLAGGMRSCTFRISTSRCGKRWMWFCSNGGDETFKQITYREENR